MDGPVLTRRHLTAGLGAIVVAFSLRQPGVVAQHAVRLPGSLQGNRMLDAWLRINADGSATVFTGKVELGQGAITALAQIAAEELDLPLSRVAMIAGDTARTPDEGHTAGSVSIESSGTALRLAGAEVRAILLALAARNFGVTPDKLAVSDGVISMPGGRKIGYGELAGAADLHREASATVAPKTASAHRIVGRSVPRLDIPHKVTGGLAYVQDVRLPGMLHGRIVRPPRYGAKLAGLAKSAAPDNVVAVVRDGSFLGVIAEREEQAIKARRWLAQNASWSGGNDLPDQDRLAEHLMAMPANDMVVNEKSGSGPAGVRSLEATYSKPYTMHGAIGPSCAVAQFADGKLTVWSHTQGVFPLRRDLAKVLRMDEGAIRCIHAEGSGCYGHNGADDVR
jgi:nicotinate dehydrogenase subunit B